MYIMTNALTDFVYMYIYIATYISEFFFQSTQKSTPCKALAGVAWPLITPLLLLKLFAKLPRL